MKLAVSNIAWTNDEETEVAQLLQELGVKYIEVAPTKLWEEPTKASQEDIKAYKSFWKQYGIEIVAFQSMLFTQPALKIFESSENRHETLAYLGDFIGLASAMGAKVMVFGSPKNRQRGEMSLADANSIAHDFFSSLGKIAEEKGVAFCIEPNPVNYACDFVTNASEGIKLVGEVNNPGFRLHLDIAGMTLAGDSIVDSIKQAAPLLTHFHISSPMLDAVEDREDIKHRAAAQALRDIEYRGYVSIEMRPGNEGTNVERVREAVTFAQEVYV